MDVADDASVDVFGFYRCTYTVDTTIDGRRAKKVLLRDVSATIESGRVLAILGPSGAGKTTLLNILTLEVGAGKAEGNVTLNGETLTPALFARHCAYVPQADQLWTFLTAREHVDFAYECFRPSIGRAERARLVAELLRATGNESCADTKAGGGLIRGLSGGQRRRLSLAIALAKAPDVVVLDEPTSGLDSAASASIMRFLKEVAPRFRAAIVCTIHQPSASVFAGFDQTLILSGGRTAYAGPACELADYLRKIGRPGGDANPAEAILDLVNKDFSDAAEVEAMLAEWESRSRNPEPSAPKRLRRPYVRASAGRQLRALLQRCARLAVRDPTLYLGRMLVFALANGFFALAYLKARERTQAQASFRLFLLMWTMGIPTCMAVVAVIVLHAELGAIRREVRGGMYSCLSYVGAHSVLQTAMMLVIAACALAPMYAISDWYAPHFVHMLAVDATLFLAFECLAQTCALAHGNPLLGMLSQISFWFMSFLFCGVVLDPDNVFWPLRALVFVSPLHWAFNAASYLEFAPTNWQGAVACGANATPGERPAFCGNGTACMSRSKGGSLFCCPHVPPAEAGFACNGATGEQMLETLSQLYTDVGTEDHVLTDLAGVLAIAAVFKLAYVVLLWVACNPSTRLKPVAAAASLANSMRNSMRASSRESISRAASMRTALLAGRNEQSAASSTGVAAEGSHGTDPDESAGVPRCSPDAPPPTAAGRHELTV